MALHEHDEDCECCSNGPEAFMEKLEQNIREYGVAILGTSTDIAGRGVSMTYTIGLADAGLPEIVTFGLPMHVAQVLLNQAAVMLREGKLRLDAAVEELGNLPLVFKNAPAHSVVDFIVQANNRAGRNLPALQMFWPDQAGHFPWDKGFDKRFKGMQPMLYTETH